VSHSTSCFMLGIFEIGSHKLFPQGWLWTMILLIAASWVARIIGVSHQPLAIWQSGFHLLQIFWGQGIVPTLYVLQPLFIKLLVLSSWLHTVKPRDHRLLQAVLFDIFFPISS
jgi:hypothetical protein